MVTESDAHDIRPKRLPLWVISLGVLFMVGTAMLALRLMWEMTLLTWQEGPQMVGFSLMHGYFAAIILFPILLVLWLVAVTITFLVWRVRCHRIARQAWLTALEAVALLAILSVPQSFYDTVFVSQLAHSSHSQELMVNASVYGEYRCVRGMLNRGVPVNGTNREGSTALHFAARAGNDRIVNLLLEHGANVNAVNLWGDSPLHDASRNGQNSTAQILVAHGGRAIQGDAAQRDRAAHDIVARAIHEMDRNRR